MARKENPIPTGNLNELPLGARMRQTRQERGFSLGDVADELGYSKAHLSAVENRTVRPSRDLVAGYERILSLPAQPLRPIYERESELQPERSRAGRVSSSARAAAPAWETPVAAPSLDGE